MSQQPKETYATDEGRPAAKWLMVGWGIFFLAFTAVSLPSGGIAINGKAENGRYYFGNHGEYTEVSQEAFIASAVCTIIWPVLMPVMLFIEFWGRWTRGKVFFLVLLTFVVFAFAVQSINAIKAALTPGGVYISARPTSLSTPIPALPANSKVGQAVPDDGVDVRMC